MSGRHLRLIDENIAYSNTARLYRQLIQRLINKDYLKNIYRIYIFKELKSINIKA